MSSSIRRFAAVNLVTKSNNKVTKSLAVSTAGPLPDTPLRIKSSVLRRESLCLWYASTLGRPEQISFNMVISKK